MDEQGRLCLGAKAMIDSARRFAQRHGAVASRIAMMVALCVVPAAAETVTRRDTNSALEARKLARIRVLRARIAKLDDEIRRLQAKRGQRIEQALLGGLITDAAISPPFQIGRAHV